MPRHTLSEQLKNEGVGFGDLMDLDDETRAKANVVKLNPKTRLADFISPAGTEDRIPLTAPNMSTEQGVHTFGSQSLAGVDPRPPSELSTTQPSLVGREAGQRPPTPPQQLSLSELISSPAAQHFLGTFAQAFAQGDTSQPGHILGQAGIESAKRRSAANYFKRLARGEDPSEISGPDVAALSSEDRANAIRLVETQKAAQRDEERLKLQERQQRENEKIQREQLTQGERRLAQADDANRLARQKFEFDKIFDTLKFDFSVEGREFEEQLALATLDLRERGTDSLVRLRDAELKLTQATTQLRKAQTSAAGGEGGEGAQLSTLDLGRVQDIRRDALSEVETFRALSNSQRIIISEIEAIDPEDRTPLQQKQLDAARTIQDISTEQTERLIPQIESAGKIVSEGIKALDAASRGEAPPEKESDLVQNVRRAVEIKDPILMRATADAAYTADEISATQRQSIYDAAAVIDAERRGGAGRGERRSILPGRQQ